MEEDRPEILEPTVFEFEEVVDGCNVKLKITCGSPEGFVEATKIADNWKRGLVSMALEMDK